MLTLSKYDLPYTKIEDKRKIYNITVVHFSFLKRFRLSNQL
jgi:hypothetical protein